MKTMIFVISLFTVGAQAKTLICIQKAHPIFARTAVVAEVKSATELGRYHVGAWNTETHEITTSYVGGSHAEYVELFENGHYGQNPGFKFEYSSLGFYALVVPHDFTQHSEFEGVLVERVGRGDGETRAAHCQIR